MKCIKCGTDSKYPDRVKKPNCAQCGEKFAFEPKTDPLRIADGLLKRCIDDVSVKGKLLFTERQLYYEFCRRLLKKMPNMGVVGGVALGVVTTVVSVIACAATATPFPLVIAVCGIGGGVAIGVSAKRKKSTTPLAPILFQDFQARYLSKWVQAHGEIEQLLKPPSTPSTNGETPADLAAYSFDRALITGSKDVAAMLVANRFHFENNCAILSLDGYPEHAFDTVMQMLRRNPNLTVFAIHGASSAGMRLAAHLREEKWFPDPSIRIIDLGLRPQHAIKMKLIALQDTPQPAQPGLSSIITPQERAWLESGLFVELSVLRPAKLMKAIFQGFAKANQPGVFDSDSGTGVWISDPGVDVYASDSFG